MNNQIYLPKLIESIPGPVISISAGDYHSLALLESGLVFAWGRNNEGQLGNKTNEESPCPQLVKGIPNKVVAIAAGSSHSLALLDNGDVYGWGRNNVGPLKKGESKSVLYPKIISKVDKSILLGPFGKGGRVVDYSELEKKFRKLLSVEFRL